MQRKINIICQAKGGVGKSLITYLLAICKQNQSDCLFVDVDSSTKTSMHQLQFLGENRTEMLSLFNNNEVLIRDQLFAYLESLQGSPFSEFFLDFGAPESEQLPALLERDLPFKEFCEALNLTVHFNIIIAGGGAYAASMAYLQKMLKALKNEFGITVWQSITTFGNSNYLTNELQMNCKKLNIPLRQFGDFEPNSNLGSQILDGIRRSFNLEDYQIGAKIKLKRELNLNFAEELNVNQPQ